MSHVSSYYPFHVSDELHVLDLGSVVDIRDSHHACAC